MPYTRDSAPNDIPPEIWVEISAYLTSREVRSLATLCRTFSVLAHQERAKSVFVSTRPSPSVNPLQLSQKDWRIVGSRIAKQLSKHCLDGTASQTRQIVFYWSHIPVSPKLSSFNSAWSSNTARSLTSLFQWTSTNSLTKVYLKYTSIESLSFLSSQTFVPITPTCFPYLAIPSLWESFGSNLRELSISVPNTTGLSEILPSQESKNILLPRLEIMRFAYLNRAGRGSSTRDSIFRRLATLYTNESLQCLQLRVRCPTLGWNEVADFFMALLPNPKKHIFKNIRRVELVCSSVHSLHLPSHVDYVMAWIEKHASTLRGVRIRGLSSIVERLVNRTPSFSLAPDLEQPFFSLTVNDLSDVLDDWNGVLGLVQRNLRDVECTNHLRDGKTNVFLKKITRHSFPNLQRLAIAVTSFELELLVELASQLPRLVSLSMKFGVCKMVLFEYSIVPGWIASVLAKWKLKDISLYLMNGIPPPVPTYYQLMVAVAKLIPSVESFEGRGDMLRERAAWETVWPWKKNVYMNGLWDGD
ncbi:hypothetical protein DL96DRAFT_713081 [Flagelloscypha sp. PMI_526]|nr:hypothetical protein DL96DRAFT_713081 [Flagelloscypha sp. PMI_526]